MLPKLVLPAEDAQGLVVYTNSTLYTSVLHHTWRMEPICILELLSNLCKFTWCNIHWNRNTLLWLNQNNIIYINKVISVCGYTMASRVNLLEEPCTVLCWITQSLPSILDFLLLHFTFGETYAGPGRGGIMYEHLKYWAGNVSRSQLKLMEDIFGTIVRKGRIDAVPMH